MSGKHSAVCVWTNSRRCVSVRRDITLHNNFHLDILRFNYVQPIKLNAVYSLSFVHDRAPELLTTLIASRLHPLPCKKVES